MKKNKGNMNPTKFTAGAFLEHVMPQIKISQKSFPLTGINPKTKDQVFQHQSIEVRANY